MSPCLVGRQAVEEVLVCAPSDRLPNAPNSRVAGVVHQDAYRFLPTRRRKFRILQPECSPELTKPFRTIVRGSAQAIVKKFLFPRKHATKQQLPTRNKEPQSLIPLLHVKRSASSVFYLIAHELLPLSPQ